MSADTDVQVGVLYKARDPYLNEYREHLTDVLNALCASPLMGNNLPTEWNVDDLILVTKVEGPSGWNSEPGNRVYLLRGDKEFYVGDGWFLAYFEPVDG